MNRRGGLVRCFNRFLVFPLIPGVIMVSKRKPRSRDHGKGENHGQAEVEVPRGSHRPEAAEPGGGPPGIAVETRKQDKKGKFLLSRVVREEGSSAR